MLETPVEDMPQTALEDTVVGEEIQKPLTKRLLFHLEESFLPDIQT